jgi:two-component system chemotaxis sensor kinase CheA
MNPLLEQFLSESREVSQGIGEKLMQLEEAPDDQDVIKELFRLVHTLKGNSGLFTFPEMTRVLHAGEDLLGMVRDGQIAYSRELADALLNAVDFVTVLCSEIEATDNIDASRAQDSVQMAAALRALMPEAAASERSGPSPAIGTISPTREGREETELPLLGHVPEDTRMEAFRQCQRGEALHWVVYSPTHDCFFQGDDPFFAARQTPGLLWGRAVASGALPPLAELDTYRCALEFQLLTTAPREELAEHYRYVPDQIKMIEVHPLWLVMPQGVPGQDASDADFAAQASRHLNAGDLTLVQKAAVDLLQRTTAGSCRASTLRWLLLLLEVMPQDRSALRVLIDSIDNSVTPDWMRAAADQENGLPTDAPQMPHHIHQPCSEEEAAVLHAILSAQQKILMLDDRPLWGAGRLKSVAAALAGVSKALGDIASGPQIELALHESLTSGQSAPLLAWLDAHNERLSALFSVPSSPSNASGVDPANEGYAIAVPAALSETNPSRIPADDGIKFGRRAEDAHNGPKSLKVDQAKIDRLMNLIGELVVEKNALPYIAQRAEDHYGIRELSREIKGEYSVINRIADEMQDAIMQVRMMAVSFVFQRFPRLVRDISRRLGKEVHLVLEGEQTEADKNIIESLADPLIHIVRNSLDHGLETPAVREAAGKPPTGTLTIRAAQQADRVVIEIIDDGKGIDPAVIKRKAYEKGLIDEAELERIGDREAVNLIFAAGLSTAEVVSDLSGRGVGMDVVRSAVEKINGTVVVESKLGKGTSIRISLPLSMAVTQVMIVESDGQLFGVPMDHVVETVRVPKTEIHAIKQNLAAVLRGRIVPLKALNTLLGISAIPKSNADDELAVLLVQAGSEVLGLLVDGFKETMGLIQKPLAGFLSGLPAYSGSALMGDGSVLMILNIREIV